MMNMNKSCALCNSNEQLTEHHLIPKSIQSRKKIVKENKEELIGKTIPLCFACHSAIHSLFTEKELSETLYTYELLKHNEQINKFVKWKIKHPNMTNIPSKASNRKKRK